MTTENQEILSVRDVTKQFPRVLANKNISIHLNKGEVVALLGENGAGKSTLMNILYGLYRPTSGSIHLKGKEVRFRSPREAIEQGLGMVHQHFMLIDTLTVTENIILGNEPAIAGFVDYRKAREKVAALSDRFGLKIDPDAFIGDIPVGLQQRVEILKALYRNAEILILDEPTAVLTPAEVEELFAVVGSLRKAGVSIIIITHKLEEVMAIADRVYILKRGVVAGERLIADCTPAELAHLMVGRDVVLTVKGDNTPPAGKPVFSVSNLQVKGNRGEAAIKGVSFGVSPGEIVGVAGVDGNGQTELAEAIVGLTKVLSGLIELDGTDLTELPLPKRLSLGMGYIPADRQKAGLVLPFTLSENLVLGRQRQKQYRHGINLDFGAMDRESEKLVRDFDIRTSSVSEKCENLSGGNQQKVILARELSRNPRFLLVSQPTRGLDVGAIEYIHGQLLAMRERGTAILLFSLELEEIFALCDRILVLFEGQVVASFKTDKTNEKEVGLHMTGGHKPGVSA
jgi:simple sugar transport system ATP-binding protein